MAAIDLTPAQRRAHRAGAHHLDPVVMIGADGLTPAVEREVDGALRVHGLIKVRVASDDRTAREAMLNTLAERLGAAAVQHIGKLLVLWRPVVPTDKPERGGRGAGPRVVKVVRFSKSGNHRPTVRRVRVLGNERLTPGGQVKRVRKRQASVKKKAAG